nr:UMP kinase [Candidatus Gracilibacteria bacterium]
MTKKIKRALIKISGEALAGDKGYGLDSEMLQYVVNLVKKIQGKGIDLAIVIGGGNIFRGISGESNGIDRVSGDQMGMLATFINGLALVDFFENSKIKAKLMTSIDISGIGEKFDKIKALKYIEKGNIIICVGGTGNPYFTTDTAGVLRALELECDVIVKATKVDGVYDKDPKKYDDAVKYETVTYDEVLEKDLKVMDSTAIALARDNNMSLIITNLFNKDAILNSLLGKSEGTIVEK